MYFDSTTRTRYDTNEYIIYGNYASMKLYDILGNYRAECLIDLEDIIELKQYKWYLDSVGYVRTTIDKKKIRLHRFLLKPPTNMVVDHINNNRLDNRRENLRIITHANNLRRANNNMNNKTGVRGVYLTEHNHYMVTLEYNHLIKRKTYKDKELAIIQRLIWELQYFKEFSPQIELIKSDYPYLLGINQLNNMTFTTDIQLIKNIGDELKLNPHCPCLLNKTLDSTICPCLPCRTKQNCHCGLFEPIVKD